MRITAATYNIRAGVSDGYLKKKNYLRAAEVISSINADIISLNEVGKRLPPEIREHTEYIAKQCGYKYFCFAKAAQFGAYPYGNALISRYPINDISVIPLKKFVQLLPGIYEPRCILSANIALDVPLRVICTHLGLLPDEQRLGISEVSRLIESSDVPTVFMGDMNINGLQPVITQRMGLKMRDVCAEFGKNTLLTYPAAKPRKRLDYIFVSDDIEVHDVFVVNKIASDHLPLVAEISVK